MEELHWRFLNSPAPGCVDPSSRPQSAGRGGAGARPWVGQRRPRACLNTHIWLGIGTPVVAAIALRTRAKGSCALSDGGLSNQCSKTLAAWRMNARAPGGGGAADCLCAGSRGHRWRSGVSVLSLPSSEALQVVP